jgi:shikimate dehydrogenase
MTSSQLAAAHLTGLAGYPIEHSLSPAMHNAVYEYYDLNWRYQLYPCESNAEFHDLINKIQDPASGFIGINVTMPYKIEAAQAIQVSGGELLGAGKTIQAVNCLSTKKTSAEKLQLLGRNVDGDGLVASLQNRAGLALPGLNVIICGTGAVSSVAIIALASAQVASITVISRRRQRAIDYVSTLSGQLGKPSTSLKGIGYDEYLAVQTAMHLADLIIDATPIGMFSDDLALLPISEITAKQTVLDVVYGHGQTQLIQAARAAGATAIDGLGMLIAQAALSFEVWADDQQPGIQLDHSKTLDIMAKAARAELQHRDLLQ